MPGSLGWQIIAEFDAIEQVFESGATGPTCALVANLTAIPTAPAAEGS